MGERLLQLILEEHRGKVIGVSLGLLAAIIIIAVGFWRAMFVIFCVLLGYFIGKRIDENKNFGSLIKGLFKDREQ